MRDTHLRNVDLNLLRAIQPLLEERHISRAAKRAFLSQPAMSRALNRLRATFGDPLLVRSDGTYERTPRGIIRSRSRPPLLWRQFGLHVSENPSQTLNKRRSRMAKSGGRSSDVKKFVHIQVGTGLNSASLYCKQKALKFKIVRRIDPVPILCTEPYV
jgi:hypothetical protein